jgi:lysophospholipid acyltransferase (LPLAT)-like uncharacterized protein
VRIHSRLGMEFLAALFVVLMKLIFRTLRLTVREESPDINPYATATTNHYLYCVWHDSVVVPLFSGNHRGTSALTSRHVDGSFVAGVLRWRGIKAVRGSTNRLGPAAFRQLLEALETGHMVITPDGPRGPARTMSVGIVYLASRTGRAIVPTAYRCDRPWRFKGSWTDLLIPRPFSKVLLLGAKPIFVPPDLTTEQLREYVDLVQGEMDRLNGDAPAAETAAEPDQVKTTKPATRTASAA